MHVARSRGTDTELALREMASPPKNRSSRNWANFDSDPKHGRSLRRPTAKGARMSCLLLPAKARYPDPSGGTRAEIKTNNTRLLRTTGRRVGMRGYGFD
jgi:hypothetical protein